jgi:amphi-Trp domain-containing protein
MRPDQEDPMDLEHSMQERIGREAAAERLRELADQLARHNEVSFLRDGRRVTVQVPDEIDFELEIEVGSEGNEIEVEISW